MKNEESKAEVEEDEEDFDLEPQEFIFLIDRSESMYWGDEAIKMASTALKIFMHSLPEGSKFNICGFGSDHEFLFEQSIVVDYSEETLKMALNDISTYHDRNRSLGGTEIYAPLKDIFNKPSNSGMRR